MSLGGDCVGMDVLDEATFRGDTYSGLVETDCYGVLRLEILYGSLLMQREFRDRDLLNLQRVVNAAVANRKQASRS